MTLGAEDQAAVKKAQQAQQAPNAILGGAIVGAQAGAAQPIPSAPASAPVASHAAPRSSSSVPSSSMPAAAPPSDGVDWAALAALTGAGLSSSDIASLAAGPQSASAQQAPLLDDGFQSPPPGIAASAPTDPGLSYSINTDPALMALLASIDNQTSNTESGYRRNQDELRRQLSDTLAQLPAQFDLNRERVKNSYEARGLLKSGGAEQAVGRTYADQGNEQSRLESSTADQVANLEQLIAQARVAAANQKAQAMLQGASSQGSQAVQDVG